MSTNTLKYGAFLKVLTNTVKLHIGKMWKNKTEWMILEMGKLENWNICTLIWVNQMLTA